MHDTEWKYVKEIAKMLCDAYAKHSRKKVIMSSAVGVFAAAKTALSFKDCVTIVRLQHDVKLDETGYYIDEKEL